MMLLLVIACSRAPDPAAFEDAAVATAGQARVEAFFDPDPPRTEDNTVWLHVTRGDRPVTEDVAVEAMMPEMGAMPEMRSRAETDHVGDGVWRARFDLEMAGGWTLEVDVGERQADFAFTVGSRGLIGEDAGGGPAEVDLPDTSLPEPVLAPLKEAFAAAEPVRAALRADSLPDDTELVAHLEEALATPSPVTPWIEEALRHATELAAAEDLENARIAYGQLNRALLAIASADARLTEGLHVFTCPMTTDTFPKWFQPDPTLDNPYMGAAMPGCGTPTDWTSTGPVPGEDAVRIDEGRRQQFGIRTAPVQRGTLTMDVRALGRVEWDQAAVRDVVLTTGGYVRDLRVDEVGAHVKRGEVLFTLYGPELYAAQQELLIARGGALETAASSRLRLMGMTEAQVAQVLERGTAEQVVPILSPVTGYVVEKDLVQGAAFQAGQRLYRVAALSDVWVEAEVYSEDIPYVREGAVAEVTLPNLPGVRFHSEVRLLQPSVGVAEHTRLVRLSVDNPDERLLPGMYADVRFEVPLPDRLLVPASAVLYTGPRRVVFVDQGGGRLAPREIRVGARSEGRYEVVSGLSEGEQVVVSGTFLVAAESRLRTPTELFEAPRD